MEPIFGDFLRFWVDLRDSANSIATIRLLSSFEICPSACRAASDKKDDWTEIGRLIYYWAMPIWHRKGCATSLTGGFGVFPRVSA